MGKRKHFSLSHKYLTTGSCQDLSNIYTWSEIRSGSVYGVPPDTRSRKMRGQRPWLFSGNLISSSSLLKLLMKIEIQRDWPVHQTGALKVWVCTAQPPSCSSWYWFCTAIKESKETAFNYFWPKEWLPPRRFVRYNTLFSFRSLCVRGVRYSVSLNSRTKKNKTLHPVSLNVPTSFSVFVRYKTTSLVSALVPSFVAV